MKITNNYNLPQPFVDFEEAHQHSAGDAEFSMTTLLSPPQIVQLEKEHDEILTEDVSDAILRLLGTAVHAVLEVSSGHIEDERAINEKRFFSEVGGRKISGQVDRLEKINKDLPWTVAGCHLQDYKVTSADTIIYNPNGKTDWTHQVNGYAFLATDNGYNVKTGEIICVIRDWKKSKAMYTKGYPERPIHRIPIDIWDKQDTYDFLEEKIRQHSIVPAIPCTDEDRWIGATRYAVYRYTANGELQGKAARVLDSRYEAEEYFMDKAINGQIVERPGTPRRCEDWCGVSKFCKQYNGEK